MWPFDKKKYDENSITDILMRRSDTFISKGIINEDTAEFIRIALDIATMETENRINMANSVANRCEKMMNSCKDDRFKSMIENIAKMMRSEENIMKENLNILKEHRIELEKQLDKSLEKQKIDKFWQY